MFFNHESNDLQIAISAIVDLETQIVYCVDITRSDSLKPDIAVRWFHPDYEKAYYKEAKKRKICGKESWDGGEYIDTKDEKTIKSLIKNLMKVSKQ
jgi:hypothetical protein